MSGHSNVPTIWHDEGHGVWLFPEYDGPAAMKVRAVCACGHDFMPDDAEVDFDYLGELIEAHRSGSSPRDGDAS